MLRKAAVDALERMDRGGTPAAEEIARVLSRHSLSHRDRSLLREIVLGVTRHRDSIDAILASFSRVKLRKVHRRVLQALRAAVYQMVWLDRIPRATAVNESVELVKATFPDWIVKFVNGCLRSVSRSIELKVGGPLEPADLMRSVAIGGERSCLFTGPLFPDPREDLVGSLALRHSHPRWLVSRWLEVYGEERMESLLRAGNEPPGLWLRPAPGRLETLERELGKRKIRHEVYAAAPKAIRLVEPAGPVEELPGFRTGWFTVQDLTAMGAAAMVDPRPGERILDLCAAPGGKATHLAELAGPTAEVVAVDHDEARLALVRETTGRLGLTNVATVAADARDADIDLGEPYDRVLADVPCSNTGVLAKRVEARHRISPEQLERVTALQREILAAAAARVRPGGVLVYSTCAVLPEENRGLVESLLESDRSFELREDRETLPRAGWADGGYLARLRRLD